MSEPYFEITIEDGVISADGKDFEGEGCDTIARLIQELGETTKVVRKPDYYKHPAGVARRVSE